MSRHSDLSIGEIHSLFNWIWENDTARLAQAIDVGDINKAGFVTATQVAYLLTDITPTWVGFLTTGGGINIDDLGDVTITTPVDGEALVYSGGVWINGTSVSTLTDLSDVTITTPVLGETLGYNGANWVNTAGSTGNTHTEEDAATNTVTDVVTLSHNTTNTPVAGFGTGIEFQAETDITPDQYIGGIELQYIDPTDAIRYSQLKFNNVRQGVVNEAGVLTSGDNGGIAGNTRGKDSVEFQSRRTVATQVASGNRSAIIGGNENTASGDNSAVIGGGDSVASGDASFIGTAVSSTNSGLYSGIISGFSNNNGGGYGFIGTGYNNAITIGGHNIIGNGYQNIITAGNHGFIGTGNGNLLSGTGDFNFIGTGTGNDIQSGERNIILAGMNNISNSALGFIGNGFGNSSGTGSSATILNGQNNITSSSRHYATVINGEQNVSDHHYATVINGLGAKGKRFGEVVSNSDTFSTVGDAQGTLQLTGLVATSNTSTAWFPFNLNTLVATTGIQLDTNSVVTFDILIVGSSQTATEQYSYRIEGNASNTAGTVTINAQTVTTIFESVAGYDVRVSSSGVYLVTEVLDVAGGGTNPIRWVMSCRMVEVVFA